METLHERIKRVTQEEVEIVAYSPDWKVLFQNEKLNLEKLLPRELLKRIEHFGSTAIPNMPAKPIIDILIEVTSLAETKEKIVPLMEKRGYEYFWRPSHGDDVPPFYAWFIKRNSEGKRTHHLHMVEKDFEHWDRLYFRDYLIENDEIALQYALLKIKLAAEYKNDRVIYTQLKSDFIKTITSLAKEYYTGSKQK